MEPQPVVDATHHPELVDPTAFIAPNAVVVGRVTLGPSASVWFGVVIRGDVEGVEIGAQSNIQDGCILHADPGQPCRLGARVSLGHGAIVHGAIIEPDVLVGMRATVLNGATIGQGSLVAAGALVTPGTRIPPGSVVMGIPGRVVRTVGPDDLDQIRHTAEHYVAYAQVYRQQGAKPYSR